MDRVGVSKDFKEFVNRKDWGDYSGEWIALCNGKVIANDKNLTKVIEESSKKSPNKTPTFTKIPNKNVAMVL